MANDKQCSGRRKCMSSTWQRRASSRAYLDRDRFFSQYQGTTLLTLCSIFSWFFFHLLSPFSRVSDMDITIIIMSVLLFRILIYIISKTTWVLIRMLIYRCLLFTIPTQSFWFILAIWLNVICMLLEPTMILCLLSMWIIQ